jgi:hypothetical protein
MVRRTKSEPLRPDEPEGWRELQEKAQRERNPKKLAMLIDEMNQILTEWEKKGAAEEGTKRIRRTDAHRP